jgi:pimeloyl-ACP methyl ester carboxylesterase
MRSNRLIFPALSLSMLLLIGCSSTRPGALERVQPMSSSARAGNVYLLRGFIGIFSTGIDHLGDEINRSGVRASVFQDDQWSRLAETITAKYANHRVAEPLVLVGHSYGADDVLRIARKLDEANIKVDLLITLDPVTPPKVPKNIGYCYNLYQSNGVFDAMPWLRGIPLEQEKSIPGQLANVNIRKDRTDLLEPGTDHFNIEKKAKIHQEVIAQVLAVCPPRQTWAAAHGQSLPVIAVSASPATRPVRTASPTAMGN